MLAEFCLIVSIDDALNLATSKYIEITIDVFLNRNPTQLLDSVTSTLFVHLDKVYGGLCCTYQRVQ